MEEIWTERARERLKALGMSHQRLADLLGVTRGSVGHYLAGRRDPHLGQLRRIAEALGVHPAWLLFGLEAAGIREDRPGYGVPLVSVPVSGTTRTGPGKSGGKSVDLPVIEDGCYALIVEGPDYAPRLLEGEAVLACPGQAPEPGDEVAARFTDGTFELLRLLEQDGKMMKFASLRGEGGTKPVAEGELSLLHTVVAVFRAGYSGR